MKQHSQIIYVLNTFSNKQAIESQSATFENITDVVSKINKVHISAFGETSQAEIVKINCWTGEGIAELMTSAKQMLELDKAKVFDELINYQNKKAPVEFSNQVKREILKFAAHVNLVTHGTYGKRKKVYEVVGYHTKIVTRQVIDRYKEEYSHTEYWEEETGEVKLVGTSYYYFGYNAVSLLLTLAHLTASDIIGDQNLKNIQDCYESLYKIISSKVNKLPSFPTQPQENNIFNILESELDKLFEGAFKVGAHRNN
ncbi:hypothetical protein RIVM261_091530 [Rivularia sp. IAM M-261]|nr:hypothetical protein CAL7716_020470 [Calothrix sp. PCC 7716]GJD24197.1 hypothetical protein RIVM261_091530 [Rivularia sp. IAM M-261]